MWQPWQVLGATPGSTRSAWPPANSERDQGVYSSIPKKVAGLPVSRSRNERWHEPHSSAVRKSDGATCALCSAMERGSSPGSVTSRVARVYEPLPRRRVATMPWQVWQVIAAWARWSSGATFASIAPSTSRATSWHPAHIRLAARPAPSRTRSTLTR